MKRSAGILVYKKEDNDYKVLLAHMGGPYWENVNYGGWSIPKGEFNVGENALKAALREFKEETNIEIKNNIEFLGSFKVSNKKLVTIFTTEESPDTSNFKSNLFEKEWPPLSGKIEQFPEMDKVEWFTINEAKKVILPNQIWFIEKLYNKLKRS